jgi:class 3 adenylate cyclase/tetratricopeptide (TPR) repeat protein
MAPGAEPLVRKTVTVLFCDVSGFTSLGERMDPETMRRVMLRYFDEMRAVLEWHGGTVEKFIGDAVMAVFGVPQLHEDDALRAVRAADEMRRKLSELNDELHRRWGVRLEARIGINTGEVVAGEGQTIATGDAVNVAARLQQAAQPGEVLLGKETYALVSGAVNAGPLESFPIKGKSKEVRTWRLDDVRSSAEQVFRRLGSPLVGREAEQEVLHRLYRGALEEQSCELVTVLGPAGIGKTRLAQEVAARLFGATVVQGRCLPYGDGITFFPVVEMVRSLASITADDPPERIRARIAALTDGDEIVSDRITDVLGLGGDARADEAFWALRKLFEAAARERPLVLVLEDVHWAEATLLDFVEYLVGWCRGSPMMVICLARPELLEARPGWLGEYLVLEPLDDDVVRALLENVLGSAQLEPDAARRIAKAAEGNPLFVEELVRMLVDDGELERRDGRWVAVGDLDSLTIPPTINAVLSARLDRLDPEERAVLQCASVVGKQFWWSAVTELASSPMRPRVAAHLHALVRKRLVLPAESTTFAGEDSFRFGHILVRDAAYAALPKSRRADLHERFAAWLEQRGAFEEIRGHHLEQAYLARVEVAPADDSAQALGRRAAALLGSAGRRAAVRGDTPAAASLLTRATRLLPVGEQRAEFLLDLGTTLMRRGEFVQAQECLEEAIATGDPRIALRARIELAFLRMLVDPKGSTRRMQEVAEEAIPTLEALGDEVGQARAWWLRSEVDVVACRWSDRAASLERALEHARRAGDGGQQGTLIRHLAHALVYGPAPVDEGLARCEEFLAEAGSDATLRASLLSSVAGLRAMQGDFAEARRLYSEARAIYDELGLSSLRAMRSLVPASIEMLAGNPDAAERELRWGYDTLATMGERGIRSTLAAFLAEVLYAQGRLDEAEGLSRVSEEAAAEDDLVTQTIWRTARAKVLARRGDVETAERLADEAKALAEGTDFPDLQATAFLALAEVLRASGETTEAEPLIEAARATYRRKGNVVAADRTAQVLAAAT